MTEYLTSQNVTETGNGFLKVLSNIKITWLSCKLTLQSYVIDSNVVSLKLKNIDLQESIVGYHDKRSQGCS